VPLSRSVARPGQGAPVDVGGRFAKSLFDVDPDTETVTWRAGRIVPFRCDRYGDGVARFAPVCENCRLRDERAERALCRRGRAPVCLAESRAAGLGWVEDCRSTRPKLEGHLGHLMRCCHSRRHRRARVKAEVHADLDLLAACVNLARLAMIGLASTPTGRAAAMP